MFFEFPNQHGGFAEVPSGTHGLFGSNGTTEIGKLVCIPVPDDPPFSRDIWIWSGSSGFPDVFKLRAFVVPTKGVQGAQVYEYPDKVFSGEKVSRAIPDPSSNTVFKVEIGTTHIGYVHLVSTTNDTDWYISTINAVTGRLALAKNDVLTFTKLSAAQNDFECYKLQIDRLTAM